MQKFIRFYHQNMKKIWIIVLVIVLLFGLVKLANYQVKKSLKEEIAQSNNVTLTESNQTYSNLSLEVEKSVVSGEKLSNSQKESISIIDTFISYCKNGEINNAYDLLSDECKEEMYTTIELFQESYYEPKFLNGYTSVSIENWIDDTYKVEFRQDALASGTYSDSVLQDYITIIEDSNKININGYIGRTNMSKKQEQENIIITMLQKDTYMDYEKYTIKFDNNSQNDILLDTKQDMKSMYIIDKKGAKYSAYTQELTDADLIVYRNSTRTITIKYYSSFVSNKTIERLVFSNVIMDYDASSKITSNKKLQEIKINV